MQAFALLALEAFLVQKGIQEYSLSRTVFTLINDAQGVTTGQNNNAGGSYNLEDGENGQVIRINLGSNPFMLTGVQMLVPSLDYANELEISSKGEYGKFSLINNTELKDYDSFYGYRLVAEPVLFHSGTLEAKAVIQRQRNSIYTFSGYVIQI